MTNNDQTSQLKQALVTLKNLRTRLTELEQAKKEPIAIIGMGCRFPGRADSTEAYWELLKNGADAITEVPAERWNIDEYYTPEPNAPGKMSTRWGGFLENIDQFDPAFFGISPREAERMDPQQRVLLEVAWEALENAGQTTSTLNGSRTGVFVGIQNQSSDYYWFQLADPNSLEPYTGTGTAHNVATGRISYLFNLHGPSVAIDTACSSSLVATHLACQSLRQGECDLAIAGGVNLILSPSFTIFASKMLFMAPDGRCKPFDAQANGFVRSEGCGVVVLKRLTDALHDGDPILAVVRGSAINQDGRSNGITAPNGLSQEQVIRAALANAGVSAAQISFIETHGTGTSLGDPIEAEALKAVFRQSGAEPSICYLGSSKSNIGHAESAAGVAGLIKTVLTLQNKAIPPMVHFNALNPNIDFSGTPFQIPTKLQDWPTGPEKRLAGLSSFGWSGTNVHLILEEAPPAKQPEADLSIRRPYLLPLSAYTMEALRSVAVQYRSLLAQEKNHLQNVCFTASTRRTHHTARISVVGDSKSELVEKLASFVEEGFHSDVVINQILPGQNPKVAFVFPGQGSQWPGMCRELMANEPVFAAMIQRCEIALQPYVDWSLTQLILAADSEARFEEIDVIQPALFAIQVALFALWQSWGVTPDAVIGHSLGEVAAAYAAGALTLEAAAKVVCIRSQLFNRIAGRGAMLAVGLPLQEAKQAIGEYEDLVSIGVSNSYRSTVLSGDPAALTSIMAQLQSKDIFCRYVKINVASHSPQADPLLADLREFLADLVPQASTVPFYSTARGKMSHGIDLDADYWAANMRQPVLFASMTERLIEDGHTIFLEISPHPVLSHPIEETLHLVEKSGHTLLSLRREAPEQKTMLASLGILYTLGIDIDWSTLYPQGGQVVPMPTYPWQHERYWIQHTANSIPYTQTFASQIPTASREHPILGNRLPDLAFAPEVVTWQNSVDQRFIQFLTENYGVTKPAPLPATILADMALQAVNSAHGEKNHTVTALRQESKILLDEDKNTTIQLVLNTNSTANCAIEIFTRQAPAADWLKIASLDVRVGNIPTDWLYDLKWEQKPSPGEVVLSKAPEVGAWLVFTDQRGLGREIAAQITRHGATCILVTAADNFGVQPDGSITINPASQQDYKRLFSEIHSPAKGLIFLWGLDKDPSLSISTKPPIETLPLAALYALQAVENQNGETIPRIWFVTRGVQPVEEAPAEEDLPSSLLWGLGRVASLEIPKNWGGLIDLSPNQEGDQIEADLILSEVISNSNEDQVAWRNGNRYVPRLAKSRYPVPNVVSSLQCRPDATYLITGGLGAWGLRLAHWLASKGARQLVLTSRTGLPDRTDWPSLPGDSPQSRQIKSILELEAQGVHIVIAQADIADLSAMQKVFAQFGTSLPDLAGVIHTAGVANPQPLANLNRDSFVEVMRPKVTGTWVLHQLTRKIALDFCVFFSSGASIWGSQGLGHYAAANHFMDSLAHHRTALGLPTLSINWGWLAGGGMASAELEQFFQQIGLLPVPAEQAIEALTYLVEVGETQAGVAVFAWEKFKPIYEAKRVRPLLEQINVAVQADEKSTEKQASNLLETIDRAKPKERKNMLASFVREAVAKVLKCDPEAIDPQQGFFKIGMDSIMTVELRTRLERSLNTSLPPTIAFEYSTVSQMTDYLYNSVLHIEQPDQKIPGVGLPEDSSSDSQEDAHLEALSDDELLSILDDELNIIDTLED